jgi:hypothetical protein
MKKITSISERYFLGSYIEQQRQRWLFDQPFLIGVVLTMIVPQLIFFLYFGSFFALVFGVCAFGGGSLGVVRASRRSSGPFTELRLGPVSQTLATFKTPKKAA